MSFDQLVRCAAPHAPSTALAVTTTAAPIVAVAALAIVAVVFVVLAWRCSGDAQPFDLRCGPFRLRFGVVPDDTS